MALFIAHLAFNRRSQIGYLVGIGGCSGGGYRATAGRCRTLMKAFVKNRPTGKRSETRWENGENGSSAEIYLVFASHNCFP
jgi:hypothetical protein